jgi:hypothetical protein
MGHPEAYIPPFAMRLRRVGHPEVVFLLRAAADYSVGVALAKGSPPMGTNLRTRAS